MDIGYIRVSTAEQNTARQVAALSFCGKVYEEHISGKDMHRPQLQEMLSSVREGDTVWVTELSRLARSNIDLCTIAKELMDKGVALKSMKENIDLSSATGVFTFQVMSAMAEFERSLSKERQREGIAQQMLRVNAGERDPWGKKATYEISDEDFLAYHEGRMRRGEIVEKYGIKEPTTVNARYKTWKKRKGLE